MTGATSATTTACSSAASRRSGASTSPTWCRPGATRWPTSTASSGACSAPCPPTTTSPTSTSAGGWREQGISVGLRVGTTDALPDLWGSIGQKVRACATLLVDDAGPAGDADRAAPPADSMDLGLAGQDGRRGQPPSAAQPEKSGSTEPHGPKDTRASPTNRPSRRGQVVVLPDPGAHRDRQEVARPRAGEGRREAAARPSDDRAATTGLRGRCTLVLSGASLCERSCSDRRLPRVGAHSSEWGQSVRTIRAVTAGFRGSVHTRPERASLCERSCSDHRPPRVGGRGRGPTGSSSGLRAFRPTGRPALRGWRRSPCAPGRRRRGRPGLRRH